MRRGPHRRRSGWVGRMKALEVESATISAYMVGLAPVASAILTAMGTRMVVAPTLDMTRLNTVASTASQHGQVRFPLFVSDACRRRRVLMLITGEWIEFVNWG